MEEVDGIIVHSLRLIGCELDEDVRRISQFKNDQVVDAVARCLRRCGAGNLDLPVVNIPGSISTVPMTARLRIGATLAQACQELDYPGEVGYQTFLYWDESDIRRLLIFLIEKMPKETEKSVDVEPLGASALLDARIAASIKRTLNVFWLPKVFRFNDDHWAQDYGRTRPFRSCHLSYPKNMTTATKECRRYYCEHLDLVSDQPTSSLDLVASVMEMNEEYVSGVQAWESDWKHRGTEHEFRSKKKLQIEKTLGVYVQKALLNVSPREVDVPSVDLKRMTVVTAPSVPTPKLADEAETILQSANVERPSIEVDEKETMQKRLENEHANLEELGGHLEALLLDGTRLDASVRQMSAQVSQLEIDSERLDSTLSLQKRTLALLPDADSNVGRLQTVIEASVARLQALAAQWDEHRQPLVDRYRTLKETSASRVSETQRKLEEIRSLREKMKEIADDARTKGEVYRQLTSDYEKMTKDFSRWSYTRRILEIVANIKKQKLDIDKVLMDTREVQKEINQLSGKLERTFAVTDELIFKDAKKDEAVRKAYKYLAALHENCSLLVKTVEETGAIMREIRDLEDQIENENQNKVLANLERISADYKQMRQENVALVAKLKAGHSQLSICGDDDDNDDE